MGGVECRGCWMQLGAVVWKGGHAGGTVMSFHLRRAASTQALLGDGGRHGGLLKIKECWFSYLSIVASLALENWMGLGPWGEKIYQFRGLGHRENLTTSLHPFCQSLCSLLKWKHVQQLTCK